MNATVAPGHQFAPPPEGGRRRALAWSIAAHVLLVIVLALALRWKTAPTNDAVDAELWAPTAEQSAPAAQTFSPASKFNALKKMARCLW